MTYPSAQSRESLPLVPPILARVMRPLPLFPLEIVLAGFMQRLCGRNPRIFARLGDHAGKRFGIKATDLPFAFVIEACAERPGLLVMRELPTGLDAAISSSLVNLLALVEGRVDGDALMFSRQLVIEGDVEAVLALRNAIDNAGLDLVEEVASIFGPLGEPVRQVLDAARKSLIKPNPLSQETSPWS